MKRKYEFGEKYDATATSVIKAKEEGQELNTSNFVIPAVYLGNDTFLVNGSRGLVTCSEDEAYTKENLVALHLKHPSEAQRLLIEIIKPELLEALVA